MRSTTNILITIIAWLLMLLSFALIQAAVLPTTPFPLPQQLPEGLLSCLDEQIPEKSCGTGIINAYKAVQKAQNLLYERQQS